MHVYTPPGYEAGAEKYPVLYLLHGAGDSDDSWTSVGRANFILDNLIAAKKARPMIVVMPAGHTGPFSFGMPTAAPDGGLGNGRVRGRLREGHPALRREALPRADRPAESGDRRAVDGRRADAEHRRLAADGLRLRRRVQLRGGLRQGGRLGEGTQGRRSTTPTPKKGLKLLWFATGKDDFLLARTKETVELFKKHGFNPVFKETSGGHTWINWQQYLNEFAPATVPVRRGWQASPRREAEGEHSPRLARGLVAVPPGLNGSAMRPDTRLGSRRPASPLPMVCLGLLIAAPAEARVTRIVIDAKQSPAYDGKSFGVAGTYERITGARLRRVRPPGSPATRSSPTWT